MGAALLISKYGDGIPLAIRMAEEGSIVKVILKEPSAQPSLTGYHNPLKIQRPLMLEQYDLILFDMVGLGQQADQLKSKGKMVIGGGVFNDKLELDRNYGQRVVKRLLPKVKLPGGKLINSQDELLKELETDQPKVIKPLNNQSPTLTLVSQDDQNRTLKTLAKRLNNLTPCILQNKVDGIEISTEGWFNGKHFINQLFNHTIENKRFMEGDKGCQTGCMGNVVWTSDPNKDRIIQHALLPLTPLLKKVDYLGPIDINCIITENDIYFLEFTARFGYDAIQAFTELYKGKLFDMLWKLAVQNTSFNLWSDYSIAVRLSMPPYPQDEDCSMLKGVQVLDIPQPARKHLMLSDVMLQDGTETLAGVDGVIGCVTARGQTISEARKRAYRTIDNCVIHQDVQYRRDIGLDVERKIEQLKVWGWIDA
jgi:phosphoribosylamine-glycine ligase